MGTRSERSGLSKTPDKSSGIIAVNKPLGASSHRLALALSQSLGTVVTHTGSLDPMAEGLLVCLAGEPAIQEQPRWQAAEKEYEFEVLLGFSTDTHDQLGLIVESKSYIYTDSYNSRIKDYLRSLIGSRRLKRPAYSYKLVRGKPLYWWARRGRLSEICIPEVDVSIHAAELLWTRTLTKRSLRARVRRNIARVEGDFRQKAILDRWKEALDQHPNTAFSVAGIRVTCSKGTYIRSLAHDLGQAVGLPAIALRILRTRVGSIRLDESSEFKSVRRGGVSY